MQNKLIYKVDQQTINPYLVHEILQTIKKIQERKLALSQIFQMQTLLNHLQKNPNDITIKNSVLNILSSKFLPSNQLNKLKSQSQSQLKQYLNPQAVYPLNKSGTFGVLQRKCKIKDTSIFQWQGKTQQPPKDLKQKKIANFIDKIQSFGSNGNNQLGWIPNTKQYPYRLILIDTNKSNKGVYFKTIQEATKVRIYYLNKFKVKTNVSAIINRLNKQNLRQSYVNSFYQKIIQNHRMERKSISRYSNQMVSDAKANFQNNSNAKLQKFSGAPSDKEKQFSNNTTNKMNPAMESMFRKSNTRSVYPNNYNNDGGYDKNFLNSLLQKQDRLSAASISNTPSKLSPNKMNFSVIYRLEQQYKKDMIQTWFNKMKTQKSERQKQRIQKSRIQRSRIQRQELQREKTPSIVLNQSYEKGPSRTISQAVKQNPITAQFLTIQFLKMTDIYFKPIVTIRLLNKKEKVVYQGIFNTFLKKKSPNLSYKMIITEGNQVFSTENIRYQDQSEVSIKNLNLQISVLDYLTNEQIVKDVISFKTKLFSKHTFIISSNKTVKLQILYNEAEGKSPNKNLLSIDMDSPMKQRQSQMRGSISPQNMMISTLGKINRQSTIKKQEEQITGFVLQIQPLSEQILIKIKKYWQEQSTKKGYYSIDAKMKMVQILQLGGDQALSWWLGLDEQLYSILTLLKTASSIIGFKLIKSVIPIIKILKQLYSDVQELIQSLISILVNHMDHYYMEQHFNRIFFFHKAIGLDSNCDFSSKLLLQMNTLQRILEIECPILFDKFKRRSICYTFTIFQYIYEMYSRNFPLKIFVQLWNFLIKNKQFLQMYMILIGVWLIRHYQLQLKNCRRTRQISIVFESHHGINSDLLIRQLLQLKEKYFKSNNDLVSQIKNIFVTKPLQKVMTLFYKGQTDKIDMRKEQRQIQKKTILRKFNSQKVKQLVIPIYTPKKYCFHIYFYTVPHIPGSLSLKTEGIQYQCIGYQKKRYFIITEVNSPITLQFIDNKSNEYTCQIETIKGINVFRSSLINEKNKGEKQSNKQILKSIEIQYICGVLTQTQIQVFKKNKKYQHYIGSFMTKQDLRDQMLRPVQQTLFLRQVDMGRDKQDLSKKIKVLFSQGNRNFNEIQFYLRWIQSTQLDLIQKLQLVKQYASTLSRQFFLSHNKIFQKALIQQFIGYLDFPLTNTQFQCFYNDSSDCQFDCPKVVKCRFQSPSGKQVKLQQLITFYVSERSQKYLYGDILIDDILAIVRPKIEQQLGTISEGNLLILYSSNGQLNFRDYRLKRRKNNKQLYIEQDKTQQQMKNLVQIMSMQQPQVLMTQVLPTFDKITTILDYVNNNQTKKIDINKKEKKKIAQTINILKNCQQKINRVLPMRYYSHPKNLNIPFLNYFYDLTSKIKSPQIPPIYFNNTKSDIKTVCISKMAMHFSEHKRGQNLTLERSLGLYGNLRKISPGSQNIFFWTYQDNESNQLQFYPKGYVFINYGYGVFRWQNCSVKGFRHKMKQRSIKQKSESKSKKQFLVVHKNRQFYVRQYELKIYPGEEHKLVQLQKKKDSLNADKSKNKVITMRSQKNSSNSGRNMEFLSKFIG